MFIENAGQVARAAMNLIDPSLYEQYGLLIDFLATQPQFAANPRKKSMKIGTRDYITTNAEKFARSREKKAPSIPQTAKDMMVPFIMQEYFNIPPENMDTALEWHRYAMSAENIIGELLERYIAHHLEQRGWVWCSGSLVRAIDFIGRDGDGHWFMLQVKNRDNSENSSSSAIRQGTGINKWFRTFSQRSGDNWHNFPARNHNLSEEGFRHFVTQYLSV